MAKNKGFQTLGYFMALLALAMLSCQGIGGFNPFATETPTPTLTFTPTSTFTPSPTPTATRTPTPTPLPTGVKTEDQPDGSILFSDYDNNYLMSLPEDWFVLPLSAEDFADILNEMAQENPEIKDIAEAFKQLDPNVIRVVALNKNSDYLFNGFSTNITVTAIEDKLMSSMPLDFVTGAVEESLKQQGATPVSNHELATKNANGLEVGVIEFDQTAPTATGANVQVRSKAAIFQSKGKMIMVQLTTPQQFAEELLPVLDQITDSIKLIEP